MPDGTWAESTLSSRFPKIPAASITMQKASSSSMRPSAKSATNCARNTCWLFIPAANFLTRLSGESMWSLAKKTLKGGLIKCGIALDTIRRQQGSSQHSGSTAYRKGSKEREGTGDQPSNFFATLDPLRLRLYLAERGRTAEQRW